MITLFLIAGTALTISGLVPMRGLLAQPMPAAGYSKGHAAAVISSTTAIFIGSGLVISAADIWITSL
jgi:hypothetical protein